MPNSYRDLIAWQKSIRWVAEIYRVTKSFPLDERFGLISQLRRAAVSVPSNIAEGQARLSAPDFRRFLGQARGSLVEVETQLAIAVELGYLNRDKARVLVEQTSEVARILNGLLASVSKRIDSEN